MLPLLLGPVLAQFSMDYPKTFGGVVPPVNQQLVRKFAPAIINIGDNAPVRSPIVTSCNGRNDWAITFDDGPAEFTPKLLQELKRRNIKATFFVVGVQVRDNVALLKQVVADGHELAIHTWSHPHLNSLTNQQIITEIMYTHQIIKDVTGRSCKFVRAPYGEANRRVQALIQAMGFQLIHWNRDTKDADTKGAAVRPNVDSWISSRVGNVISLEHDLHRESVDAAFYLLDQVQKADYRTVTVSQCTGLTPYGELNPDDNSPPPQESTTTKPVVTSTSAPATSTTSNPESTTSTAASATATESKKASGATSFSILGLASLVFLL